MGRPDRPKSADFDFGKNALKIDFLAQLEFSILGRLVDVPGAEGGSNLHQGSIGGREAVSESLSSS